MGFTNIPAYNWLSPVPTVGSLPTAGNSAGDARVVLSNSNIYIWDGAAWQNSTGDIGSIGSSTDNALVRWDGAGGNTVQNSGVLIDDSNNTSGVVSLHVGGSGNSVASAILELTSTTRGFLPPVMTTAQRDAISSPATGLVIYNSTTSALNIYTGSWGAVGSSGIVIGTTTVTGGATTQVLYNGSGLVQSNAAFTVDTAGGMIVGPIGGISYGTFATYELRRAGVAGMFIVSTDGGRPQFGLARVAGSEWDFIVSDGTGGATINAIFQRFNSLYYQAYQPTSAYCSIFNPVTVGSVVNAVSRLHIAETGATAVETRWTNSSTSHTSSDGLIVGLDSSGNGLITQKENLTLSIGTNNTTRLLVRANGIINFAASSIPSYADDAAAGAGGLVTGDLYRIGQTLTVKS